MGLIDCHQWTVSAIYMAFFNKKVGVNVCG